MKQYELLNADAESPIVKRLVNLYEKQDPLRKLMPVAQLKLPVYRTYPWFHDSILGTLADPKNEEPVMLFDDFGIGTLWDQVAVMTYGDGLYAILKPRLIEKQSDVDEAVVFRMKEFEGDGRLVVERDCTMITRVFEEYKRLLNQKQ